MTTIKTNSRIALLLTLTATAGVQRAAYADSTSDAPVEAVTSTASVPATVAPSDSALRYSLPWQLRPVTIGNLARVDSVAAVFNDANGNLDEAVATVVTASYQINRNWAPMVRLAFVGNDAPGEATDGSTFANPLVGATYGRAVGSYRLALFGATTLPIGTGGGNTPNIRAAKTNSASSTARPADNAMFAVNYSTAIAGADFAYVNHGLTAQAEATLLQFVRVRGEDGIGAADSFRTEAAVGLHLGYFIGSHFSLSSDLHYRRWLSRPTTLSAATGARVALSDADMASTTVAVGPRFHFRVGKQGWIRPGLSFVRGLDARGFDAPLLTAQATGVQVDVPVTF
ncbi:MAG TPA: hypothetical protein VFH68_05695 [Polyangia bacterium]|nr:hypothetical protein [Polyangia bacterium]